MLFEQGQDEAAHHIVAQTDWRAQEARDILQREGIDINDADNGVLLPSEFHQALHTDAYYATVNQVVSNAAPGTVRVVLNDSCKPFDSRSHSEKTG